MAENQWTKTTGRYVAFFDILGFRDLVMRSSHSEILTKLEYLKNKVVSLDTLSSAKILEAYKLEKDQTKSVSFSDSIIVFSKADTFNDLFKILVDTYGILYYAARSEIPIKGSLSFGTITVDFEKSLFFGQPIIDAYLLHEELQMLTAILDHKIELRLKDFPPDPIVNSIIAMGYRANLKSGKVIHSLIKPESSILSEIIGAISKLYNHVSGRPRLYIDNTLDFLKSFEEIKNK